MKTLKKVVEMLAFYSRYINFVGKITTNDDNCIQHKGMVVA